LVTPSAPRGAATRAPRHAAAPRRPGGYHRGPGAPTATLALVLASLVACRPDPAESDGEVDDTGRPPLTDAGETIEDAMPLEGGSADDARIDPAGDRDFYSFETAPGVTYAVQVRTAPNVGDLDPVLRIWDETGALLAESDDLPYGLRGGAPGALVRYAGGGTVYLEVLDKGDWDGSGGFGAPGAKYDLSMVTTDRIEPNEDTNADNDTVAQTLANSEAGAFDWYLDPWVSELHFAIGDAVVTGDVDTLSLTVREDQVPLVWQVSSMPIAATTYRMRLSLFDEAGQRLASTTDTHWKTPGITLFDAGLSCPITAPGRYFVQVQDDLGGSGPAAWYAMIGAEAPFQDAKAHDLGAPEVADEAVLLELSEGEDRIFFQTFYGWLEDFGGTPDPWDAFVIEPASGAVAGASLTVRLETAAAGSALDARLSVYDADGALLAESSVEPSGAYADDPAVLELELLRDGPVRVRIDPENGAYGLDAFYMGTVRIVQP
jgi:hypothetical protein